MKSCYFISTKIKMPYPRKDYIKREKIFDKLKKLPEYKVVLVKGAAGAGKTTLITSFINEIKLDRVCFISLDDENNNMFSFWFYVVESLKDYLDNSDMDVVSSFETMFYNEDIKNIITMIVNQLSSSGDITIVLDDLYYIKDKEVLESIEFFIKYSPNNIHIIMLTREEPQIYLSDIRMSGRLLDISEEDLKFSKDESMKFLKDTLKINMNDESIDKISSVSEGWVGGMQLIALACSNSKTDSFSNIKVLNKYVADYLSNEILKSQSDSVRDFLLKTSILEYFDENICNEYLGIENSKDIIDILLNKNMFLISIDEERGIYRYHNMFDEFLNLQLSKYGDEFVHDLHVKASNAYENAGDIDGKIRQLFKAKEYRMILAAIKKYGENSKLWNYLSKIPIDIVMEDEDMAIQRIFYHYCRMEIDECRKIFDAYENKDKNYKFMKFFESARAIIVDDNFEDNAGYVDLFTIDDIGKMNFQSVTKAIIYIKTSLLFIVQDRYKESMKLLDKALEMGRKLKNAYIIFTTLGVMVQVKEDIGDLNETLLIYDEMFKMIDKYSFLSCMKSNTLVGIAGVHVKNHDIKAAESELDETYKLIKNSNYSSPTERGYYYTLMDLKILKGEKKEALELIEKLSDYYIYNNPFYAADLLSHYFYIGAARVQKFESFIKRYESSEKSNECRITAAKLLYSRILNLRGEKDKTLELLDDVLEITRQDKIKVLLIQAILFKISVLDEKNNGRDILNLFREAVYYSCKNRIISPFVFEGDTVKKYISYFIKEKSKDLNLEEKKFTEEIYNIFFKEKSKELLSPREVEVLNELETGASNKEIAERLCISLATVKTHMINIYSKLCVKSRVEAVEKAKALNIIK